MDIKEVVAEIHIENIEGLRAKLVKVIEAVDYLVKTGILKIPEDISMDEIEKRARTALVNGIKIKTQLYKNNLRYVDAGRKI